MSASILLLVPARSESEEPRLDAAAEELCRVLFEMLDRGRFGETYALVQPLVKKTETEASWRA